MTMTDSVAASVPSSGRNTPAQLSDVVINSHYSTVTVERVTFICQTVL